MTVKQLVVIPVLSQEGVSTWPSTPPSLTNPLLCFFPSANEFPVSQWLSNFSFFSNRVFLSNENFYGFLINTTNENWCAPEPLFLTFSRYNLTESPEISPQNPRLHSTQSEYYCCNKWWIPLPGSYVPVFKLSVNIYGQNICILPFPPGSGLLACISFHQEPEYIIKWPIFDNWQKLIPLNKLNRHLTVLPTIILNKRDLTMFVLFNKYF